MQLPEELPTQAEKAQQPLAHKVQHLKEILKIAVQLKRHALQIRVQTDPEVLRQPEPAQPHLQEVAVQVAQQGVAAQQIQEAVAQQAQEAATQAAREVAARQPDQEELQV